MISAFQLFSATPPCRAVASEQRRTRSAFPPPLAALDEALAALYPARGGKSGVKSDAQPAMKTLIASVVSLLIGLGSGWYFKHRRAEHQKSEIVEQMSQGAEASRLAEAVRDARAIELIASGDTQQAVQLLSGPIARYYTLYPAAGRDDERSTKSRALIERLARTNQIVATRLSEMQEPSTNSRNENP